MAIRLTRAQSFENSSIQELIDLDNLLYNDFNTYENWHDAFKDEGKAHDYIEDKMRTESIESINEKLKANNYDGTNDYYAIYWFPKGLNLPVPQKPKRYVDSDDFLFNNLHKLKHHDKLNDFKRKRIHERFNRDLHKKDSTFLKDLMNHQKDLSEFNKYHKMHKLAEEEHAELVDKDYKAANKLRFKSYKEFNDYENNKDGQMEEINNIIEEITKDPLNWSIDFRKLSHYGKKSITARVIKNVNGRCSASD